jgi:hypothetical protein
VKDYFNQKKSCAIRTRKNQKVVIQAVIAHRRLEGRVVKCGSEKQERKNTLIKMTKL